MIGALVGDIAASRFKHIDQRSKVFGLFTEDCHLTGNSIMTLAAAQAIMAAKKSKNPFMGRLKSGSDYPLVKSMTVRYMQEMGRKYPNYGYNGMLLHWILSATPQPYNSFENDAAGRISPAGFVAKTEVEAIELAKAIAGVTHNNEEGIKGAEAVAVAVFMASCGFTKTEIRNKINRSYYPLNFTINKIRRTYQSNPTSQGTVPQAIEAVLESTSFEDAIQTAISLGGNATLATIAGSIAEAYYGLPQDIRDKALSYLDADLKAIYKEWLELIRGIGTSSQFRVITKYITRISGQESFGAWLIDTENDGTPAHPIHMPYVNFDQLVDSFVNDFYQFSASHPQYQLTQYDTILASNGIKWDDQAMRNADVQSLDAESILALIMGAIRAERFCDGALLGFFNDGFILKWLKRLKAIDDS